MMKTLHTLWVILLTVVTNAGASPVRIAAIEPAGGKTVYVDKTVQHLSIAADFAHDPSVFHLFSHGRSGELFIEGRWMNAADIALFLKDRWDSAIQHINIYGCEFAKDEKGRDAVAYLEKRLSVTVAASVNITGKDGDWVLEAGAPVIIKGFEHYDHNLQQCSPDYGTYVSDSFYATASSGGYAGGTSGSGAPDGSGIYIYNTSYTGIFTFTKTFTAGDTLRITAKYNDSRHDGVTFEFSADNNTYTAVSPVINGFPSGNTYGNVNYALPLSLTGQYKYIRVKGVSASSYLNIDAIFVKNIDCYTCTINTAPVLSAATVSNVCPSQTYDLTTITANNTPAGATLTWHSSTPASDANKIVNPAAVTGSVFYAAFYNTAGNCYSGVNGAATTIVRANGDFDCDGITDDADIDDDNDGIPDAIESPDCFYSYAEINTFTATSGLAWHSSYPVTNAVDGDNTTFTQLNPSGQAITGVSIIEIQLQDYVKVAAMDLEMGAYSISGSASNGSVKLEGWNGTVWRALSPAKYATVTNATETFVNSGYPNEVFNKLRIVGVSGTTSYARINEITLQFFGYNSSAHPKPDCNTNTDNSGGYNHRDPDSDGDGCSDSYEGGVTNNKMTDFKFTGPDSNGDGLADAVDADGDGAPDAAITYDQYALKSSLNLCIDSDNDGVGDLKDIDDDNDGVLDIIECGGTPGSSTIPSTPRSADGVLTNETGSTVNWTSVQNYVALSNGEANPSGIAEYINGFDNTGGGGTPDAYFTPASPVVIAETYGNLVFGVDYFDNVQNTASDAYQANLTVNITLHTDKGKFVHKHYLSAADKALLQTGKWIQYEARFTVPAGVLTITKYEFQLEIITGGITPAFDPGGSEVYAIAFRPNGEVGNCTLDTDNDGIPNRLDLDSDGDGCPDAKEAGSYNKTGVTTSNGNVQNGNGGTVTSTASTADAIVNGPYGGNGFVDILQATSDTNTYKYSYAYDIYISKYLNACADTDGDGIPDLTDIDDDNDGVLDAVESPSCFYTQAEVAKIVSVSTQIGTYDNTSWGINNTIDRNGSTAVQYNLESAVNKEIFRVQLPVSIAVSGIELNMGAYALSNTSGTYLNTMVLQGSNDGNNWQSLNAAQSYTKANGIDTIKIASSSLGTGYSYYRLLGQSGTMYYGRINEMSIIPYNFTASKYPKATCSSDTDNDGIVNHLDLDSDGDGCPDAKEAGTYNKASVTTSNGNVQNGSGGTVTSNTSIADAIINGPYDDNGFANVLQAASDSNNYKYSYTYDIAISSYLNACADTDSDGVPDLVDIDDDNDGVLDAVESPSCFYTKAEATKIVSVSSEISTNNTTSWGIANTIDGDINTAVQYNLESAVNKEIFRVQLPASIAVSGIQLNMGAYALSQASGTYLNTMILQGSNDGSNWQNMNMPQSYTKANDLDTIKIAAANLGTGYSYYRLLGQSGTTYYGRINEISLLAYNFSASKYPKKACSNDTDNDGIANHLDLDSDGDGCTDAKEAGTYNKAGVTTSSGNVQNGSGGTVISNTSTADAVINGPYNDNGFANVLQAMPDTNTYKYTYTYAYANAASLNFCVDSDNDGYPDLVDLDDDNDGILDVNENCGQTGASTLDGKWNYKYWTNITSYDVPYHSIVPITEGGILLGKDAYGLPYQSGTPNATSLAPAMTGAGGVPMGLPDNGGYIIELVIAEGWVKFPQNLAGTNIKVRVSPLIEGVPKTAGAWVISNNYNPNTWIDPVSPSYGPLLDMSQTTGFVGQTGHTMAPIGYDDTNDPGASIGADYARGLPWDFVATIKVSQNGHFIRNYVVDQLVSYSVTGFEYSTDGVTWIPIPASWYNSTATAAEIPCDLDGDGIPNHLDLDSDGDGCPDAIEGGANFTAANLQTSNMPGGNSGTGYTGTTINPVITNLGNAVDTDGVPTIANGGQTVNTSQDATQQDANCPFVPIHNPDFGVTYVNVPLDGNVSTNDNETPGSTYSNPAPNPSNPSNCMPTVAANGSYTFLCATPGVYVFQVPVCEPAPSNLCKTVPLTITVLDPNDASTQPVANTDYGFTKVNTPVTIDIKANDKCQNGANCTLGTPTIVTPPQHGTFNPATGVYTPATGFVGKDSLQYEVCDNQTPTPKCATAWVYIDVLPEKVPNRTNAADDYVQVPFGGTATGNVKTNDTDPEGNAQIVTAQTTTIPGKGTLTLNTNGTYSFVPVAGFSGPVEFPYQTCDVVTAPIVQACAWATIHILVEPQVPAYDPDFGVTYINVPLEGDVSTNDNPLPGGTTYGNPPANPSNPSTCTPTIAADGSYTFQCATPGVYVFQVPVCEPSPSANCTTVPLTITVLDPKDQTAVPVANPDYGITKINTPVTIDIKANDKCQNGPACTLGTPTVITQPLHGTFDPATGVYTPTTGFVGKDSLQYNVCDNQSPAPKCATAWVYIDVLPLNAPNSTEATDDYIQVPYGMNAAGSVKTNDTDPEGNQQTVMAQTTTIPGKGTLTLNTNGTYTFVPVAGFSGPVEFLYRTCDVVTAPVVQACADATLHILVEPKVPEYDPDFGVTYVNIPLEGNVSTNDGTTGGTYSNPAPNPANPASCMPTVASDGSYTFTCATPGTYTFYVPVCEPAPGTSCTTVPLTITVLSGVENAGPIANPDYATTVMNQPVLVNILSNDKCQNGPSCTLGTPAVTIPPINGTFNPATGVYTPAPGFVGKDSLQYSVCDNQTPAKCTTAWAYISVLPLNGPNTTQASDDYAQTLYNTPVSGNVQVNDKDPEGNPQTVTAQITAIPGKGTLTLNADGSYNFVPENGFYGPVDFLYKTCDVVNAPTVQACASATLHIMVMPIPDLTPVFRFRRTSLDKGQSTNAYVDITNLLAGVADPSRSQIRVRIAKPAPSSGYTYTTNGTMTSLTVFGVTAVNNTDWEFSEDAVNLTFILKPGKTINGSAISRIGFTVTRLNADNTASKVAVTATIRANSGGEINNSNNTIGAEISSNK